LPTSLIASFKSTLEEVTEADLLLHVVDASNEGYENQQDTVLEILEDLGADQLPILTVYNKKDLLEKTFFPSLHPNILISAYKDEDQAALLYKIESILKEQWDHYVISLEANQGREMHQLEMQSIVVHKEYNEKTKQYDIEGYMEKEHSLKSIIKE